MFWCCWKAEVKEPPALARLSVPLWEQYGILKLPGREKGLKQQLDG